MHYFVESVSCVRFPKPQTVLLAHCFDFETCLLGAASLSVEIFLQSVFFSFPTVLQMACNTYFLLVLVCCNLLNFVQLVPSHTFFSRKFPSPNQSIPPETCVIGAHGGFLKKEHCHQIISMQN